jgi:hypothetical protein
MLPVPLTAPAENPAPAEAAVTVNVVVPVTVTGLDVTFGDGVTAPESPVIVTRSPFESPCAWEVVYVITVVVADTNDPVMISVRAAVTVWLDTADIVVGLVKTDVLYGVVTNAA